MVWGTLAVSLYNPAWAVSVWMIAMQQNYSAFLIVRYVAMNINQN